MKHAKRILSFILLLALLSAVFVYGSAETQEPEAFTSGDYTYILLEDGTVEITKYNGKAETLEIPSGLDGKTVAVIREDAFSWCNSLTSVTIPDSVTSIGDGAFYGCNSLASVIIPDSVVNMGVNPFAYCNNLTQLNISPDHPYLATIDGVLFSKPDKRLICYPYAFTQTEYSIPQGIEIIGNWAFCSCESLASVILPDSVTTIGEGVFYGCSHLDSITIPDSVTSIGNWAFCSCESLASVILPDSVTTIGDGAFYGCNSLASVTIPDSVTAIGDYAFYDCKSLTSVSIPDSVTTIGDGAFNGCNSLASVTVSRDSYARQYCIDNGLNYTYPDANDWLNN